MILSNNDDIKRLAIFFFYDKDGVVDDYITFMLEDLNKNISELLIVCNGELQEEGRKKLEAFTPHILVRENKGFDVWAYKAGINFYGWDKLGQFDEIIFMNFTIMGPLYPFKETFDSMSKKDIDFWGMTLYHKVPYDPFGKIQYGYIPMHLQSHFIVIRKEMLISEDFQLHWGNMPMIFSYEESICYHEAIFTKKFEDCGYKWDVYVDTRDLVGHSFYPLIMSPLELVKNRRCPIIKRRSFFHNYDDFLNHNNGESSIDLLEYIERSLSYDSNLIFENILRTQNQADIKNCLHLNYLLSSCSRLNTQLALKDLKIALVMHIYFEDLVEYCFEYACSMPNTSDIYITTNSNKKKETIETVFAKAQWNKISVIVIENRGRDVSSLLVGTKEFIMNYDYVCFVHDKKVSQLDMRIKGEAFSYKCFENTLKNNVFVENIIETFETNPRLGLLTPPPPNFADYYPTISGGDWSCNFENTEKLAKNLGIKVNFDSQKAPIAPLGTMFWFRPRAMKPLFELDWKYEDFPKEPNSIDGSLLHAIERLYPFVVQNEGYYPAWVMVDTFARIEITNIFYMLRELTKISFAAYGYNSNYGLKNTMKYALMNENKADNNEMNDLDYPLHYNTHVNYGIKHSLKLLAVAIQSKYPRFWSVMLPFRRIIQIILDIKTR